MYLKPNYICHTLWKANVRGNSYMNDPEHRLWYPNAASNSMQLHGIYCQFRQRRGRCEGMVRHYVEHPCPSFRINVMTGLPLLRELADVQCSVSFHNFSNELCTQLTFCCIIVARYRNILSIFPRIPSHIKLRIWYNASQQTISRHVHISRNVLYSVHESFMSRVRYGLRNNMPTYEVDKKKCSPPGSTVKRITRVFFALHSFYVLQYPQYSNSGK